MPSYLSTPLHIAIDARTINSSTGTVIRYVLDNLQQIDTVNTYTIILDSADYDYWKPDSKLFRVTCVSAPAYSFKEQWTLRQCLRRVSPDIIHFFMPQQPLLFFRGRKITTFHDLTTLRIRNPHLSTPAFLLKNAIGWAAFRSAARESARLITHSDYTSKDVADTFGIGLNKISLVYPAGDVHRIAFEPFDHPFDQYLLYVGSHFGYKNLKRLCDAHHLLRQDRPGLGLIFVGRPDRESAFTRAYCREHNYDGVLFTGFLPDAERDWLYVHAAAYVFPSLAEGFGLPGLEAMGYGTPVVSSNKTCLPEIYGDGALYFDPENVSDMVAQIARVLDDEDLRRDLVQRGTARYNSFSWRRAAEQTLRVYEEVGAMVRRR